MRTLIHHLITQTTATYGPAVAMKHKENSLSYDELAQLVAQTAAGYQAMGLERSERVAIYLPKFPETVAACFGASQADGVMVPVNPILKPEQVKHILKDCNARILVTSALKAAQLEGILEACHDLHTLITLDGQPLSFTPPPHIKAITWSSFIDLAQNSPSNRNIDSDIAAILYTSGSTGKPKGVVLSHRNMIAGAESVAQYLNNHQGDKILSTLPLSFDYGFSQLTTAFSKGAQVVLMDYLLPREVLNVMAKESITGLAAVPTLWTQLSQLTWPDEIKTSLRYITNSGGAMPTTTLKALREHLPNTQVYLMYGLTEAFRSTYLPPEDIDRKPGSMGKAIPNAEIMVVREDGSPCAAGEPGELVHRGSLVGLGYWNSPEKTAERFKPIPNDHEGLPMEEIAVWSGDKVQKDEEGYLYFIGREDEMIKTSGYRVSPTEVEEILYESQFIEQAVVLGVPHPVLGQAIVAIVTLREEQDASTDKQLERYCKQALPAFMVPAQIVIKNNLPKNPNGKIARTELFVMHQELFSGA